MLPPRKGPDPTVWVNEVVTVRGESVASVTFAAQPTRTIGGTLSFAGRPTPLYETEVFLVVNAEPIGESPSVVWALGGNFGRVSVNGHFGITGLMPGKYRLSVSGADAFGWRPKFATVPASERRLAELDGLDAAFTVGPNQDVLGVRIDMTMATTTVTGRIDDEEGRPAPGADLVVFAPDSRYWIPGSRRLARTRTGVRGEFRITTLPEGDYLAAATRTTAGTEPVLPEWLESLRPRAVPFRLDDGEVQELALPAAWWTGFSRRGRLPPPPGMVVGEASAKAEAGPSLCVRCHTFATSLSKLFVRRRFAPANGRVSDRRLSIQRP